MQPHHVGSGSSGNSCMAHQPSPPFASAYACACAPQHAQMGTFQALMDMGVTVLYKLEVYTTLAAHHDWHQGIAAFVLSKHHKSPSPHAHFLDSPLAQMLKAEEEDGGDDDGASGPVAGQGVVVYRRPRHTEGVSSVD